MYTCRKALEKAAHDTQLKKILGEHIEIGDWYESTIGVDHEGHSAYCNFPVKGSLNNANIHLRAVRFEGRYFSLLIYCNRQPTSQLRRRQLCAKWSCELLQHFCNCKSCQNVEVLEFKIIDTYFYEHCDT